MLVALVVVLYACRDLPRYFLERQIAGALGGETHLAALEWPREIWGDTIHLELRGLTVSSPAVSPALRRLEIDRIEAYASRAQLLRGKVGSLELYGLRAEADPRRPLLAEGEGPEPPFGSLVVADGARILLVDGRGLELVTALFAATVTNGPGFPGRVDAKVQGLDLSDLEAFLPLELPALLRQQLGGLVLGEVAVTAISEVGGFSLEASGRPFERAFLQQRGGVLAAAIQGLELAALAAPGAPVAASGKASLRLDGSPDAAHLELHLGPSTFRFADHSAALGGFDLEGDWIRDAGAAAGRLAIGQLAASLLEIGLPPDSPLPAATTQLLPLRLEWQGELAPAARIASGSGAVTSGPLGRFPFEGQVSATDGFDLRIATPVLQVAQLLQLLPAPPQGGSGTVSAKIALQGPQGAATAAAELRFAELAPAGQLDQLTGTASLRWSAAAPLEVALDDFTATAVAHPPLADIAPFPVVLAARGRADLGKRAFFLRELSLDTAELGKMAGKGELELPEDLGLAGARAAASLELRGIRVKTYLATFAKGEIPGDLAFAGDFALAPQIHKEPGGPWQATGSWQLASAGFASPEGDRVLEGLGLSGDFVAELAADPAAPAAPYSLEASGESSGFQLLWGTLFGDFATARVALETRASGRLGESPRLELALRPTPGLEISAEEGPDRQYRLTVVAQDLEAVRRDWLVPLFAGVAPLRLAGRLDLEAAGELPPAAGGNFSARGRLLLEGGQLQKEGLAADGIELDLPFDLRASNGVYSGPRLSGRLATRHASLQGLELPAIASRLWVEGDSIGLEQGLEVAFAGGKVRLEKVLASKIFATSPRLETAISLESISLAELSAAAGFLPLEGRLDGLLPNVVVQGNRLEVEGGGKIALFGGDISIGDISGRDVFSPYPRLRLSARFAGLDLGQITRRFDFGEMQGILQGEIEDCEIFRNVPLAFKARIVSVETQGVKQTIDVKAVQNLTILGTGAATSIFDRGIQRFFKKYNYSQLGISAQLGNDVLLLRGLEHRGDKELFLRGKLPFSIDIVNAQPGKTVSFLAMVRRLKSLDVGKVRTSP